MDTEETVHLVVDSLPSSGFPWYELIISSPTIALAIMVVIIALRQHKLAIDKFKLDLFEKRHVVFRATRIYLTVIMEEGKLPLNKRNEFMANIADATFLFESDITDYLVEIDKKAMDLWCIIEEISDMPMGDEKKNKIGEKFELLKWLMDQLPELKPKFSPYMKFETWK